MKAVISPQASGASNGVSRRRPFDRWYRYPAGFSPAALHSALAGFESDQPHSLIIDPFAGSGSAGTAAIDRGLRFAGIEAHPEIADLAALKFSRPDRPEGLIASAERIASQVVHCPVGDESELVIRCFDEDTLSLLVGLRERVQAANRWKWGPHLKWALLGTLRDVAAVKVGWPYQRPGVERTAPHTDPVARFVERATWMSADLAAASDSSGSKVVCGDSREASAWRVALGRTKAAGCITSPPYFNNFDYADATRLELYFWGRVGTWREMCDVVRSGMMTATTQQTRCSLSATALLQLESVPTVHRAASSLMLKLAAERVQRPRGKEYDRVLAPYLRDLVLVLRNLHKHLASGARSDWLVGDSAPYGVYVDTPSLIGMVAKEVGFVHVQDELVRVRGNRWPTNGQRHQVDLSERTITFYKP